MGMTKLVVGSIVIGAFTYWLINKLSDLQSENQEEMLKKCFGDPMHVDKFTLDQAKNWIKARESAIRNGAKALVLKVNKDTMKSLGEKWIPETEIDNFLVVAIVDVNNKDVGDTLLIKYNELDENLEKLLEKGDGTLVVGG